MTRSENQRWLYVFDKGPIDCRMEWGLPATDNPPGSVLHAPIFKVPGFASKMIPTDAVPVVYQLCCVQDGVAHFVERTEFARRNPKPEI